MSIATKTLADNQQMEKLPFWQSLFQGRILSLT